MREIVEIVEINQKRSLQVSFLGFKKPELRYT